MNPSKTSTAITRRNLYITTKSLVLLHQGICYCHTVQLPSSCNCCISMHFCKTSRIQLWVFEKDLSTVSHKEIKTYIHTTSCIVFLPEGWQRIWAFYVSISDICKVGFWVPHFWWILRRVWERGKLEGDWRSHLMLLLRVSGSEARSQNTHGEQAE